MSYKMHINDYLGQKKNQAEEPTRDARAAAGLNRFPSARSTKPWRDNDIDDDSPRMPGNIVFIEIPAAMARPIGSFMVDPAVPIPVELGQETADLSGLSWEMIVAGMLRLLAYDPGNGNASYYRDFVLAVKPGIFAELSETGILKARNGELDVAEEIFKALAGLAPAAPEPMLNLAILYEDKADALDRSGKEDLADAVRDRAFETYKSLLATGTRVSRCVLQRGFLPSQEPVL